ncbi:MAG: OmpA family protein [Proteobacteria bacterium]|nr:OmpA family protein [Pseudomonadota bacterium]
MPSLSLTARSLALAGFGLGAVPAFAQSANVTAFNPYNGVGAPSAPSVSAMPQGGPAGGPAFNPWNPGSSSGWGASAGSSGAYAGSSSYYSPGANLPAPPPGPIESRLTAVPERASRATDPRTARSTASVPPQAVMAPAPEPVVTHATPPAPTPMQTRAPVVAAAPPPAAVAPAPVAVAPAPTPAPAPKAVVASAPAVPAAPSGNTLTSISFGPQSAEISGAARTDLERAAQNMKGVRQIELRAYASGSDPTEARKIALARALSVRSYLIDQGIRGRIEVGAFASSAGGAGGERVDILSQ